MSLPHAFALEFICIDIHLILVRLERTLDEIQAEWSRVLEMGIKYEPCHDCD